MSCKACVHKYDGPAGPECRRNPPQVVSCQWSGDKPIDQASTEEIRDRRNWEIVSAFPDALFHCGDYVQQVYGL